MSRPTALSAIRPGALVYRFRKTFEHGIRTAYYRDLVRPRILRSEPTVVEPDPRCEIHVLTSSSDWINLIWTLKSFFRFSCVRYALCIHDDGSLPPKAVDSLAELFPQARIVSRREADEKVLSSLTGYPRCLAFRRQNNLALKLFDFLSYLQADRMLLLDSDILFFSKPVELLQRIENPSYCLNTFNADVSSAYTVDPAVVKERFGFDLMPDFNSGLGLVHLDSLRLDWMEEFLSLPGVMSHFWRIEQTLFALCSFRYGAELLPDEYRVTLRGETSNCCKHYVGAIRQHMYSQGIASLSKNGFLTKQSGPSPC